MSNADRLDELRNKMWEGDISRLEPELGEDLTEFLTNVHSPEKDRRGPVTRVEYVRIADKHADAINRLLPLADQMLSLMAAYASERANTQQERATA